MKSLKRKVSETVERISVKIAAYACDSASILGGHQIKEPDEFKKAKEFENMINW